MKHVFVLIFLVSSALGACGVTTPTGGDGSDDDGVTGDDDDGGGGNPPPPTGCDGAACTGPMLAGCPVLPANHVFNTPIDKLPVHPNSSAFIATIGGTRKLHLDLGRTTNQQAADFYGIPYNVVRGASLAWSAVAYRATDPDLDWDPRTESDCASGPSRQVMSPCTAQVPLLPIGPNVLVEGGINSAVDQRPYGDHHLLLLDADSCRLWEAFHVYSPAPGIWNIFGSAMFDLRSNKLRPLNWSSSDAAGFPILPLLLRADEASAGEIKHALRFTIQTTKIRTSFTWPARHKTMNGTASTSLPQMGQLFRLKASYAIPASYSKQARAILQAMKTYGMYIADGGSDMYITGEPSASWGSDTISQVQSVDASQFEAVDLSPITSRAGFDPNSGAVP